MKAKNSSNTRNTIQRQLVLETAQQLDHPTAEEIYVMVRKEHPSISRGTVYRNLKRAVEKDTLRRVTVPGGADRFDITLEGHYHLVCTHCGRVQDAAIPFQADLVRRTAQHHDFQIDDHEIIFRGMCPACQAEEKQ